MHRSGLCGICVNIVLILVVPVDNNNNVHVVVMWKQNGDECVYIFSQAAEKVNNVMIFTAQVSKQCTFMPWYISL